MPDTRPEPANQAVLRIFSGLPDPRWSLGVAEAAALQAALVNLPPALAPRVWPLRGGYRGIEVTFAAARGVPQRARLFEGIATIEGRAFEDRGRALELALLSQSPALAELQVTAQDVLAPGNEVPIEGIEGDADGQPCQTAPEFPANPFTWDSPQNNCYSYANDTRNTATSFQGAQPGGKPPKLTKAALIHAATKQDGLVFEGTTLPVSCPVEPGAHILAICLAHYANGKASDYHCLRLDKNGNWSHKLGPGESVTNLDATPQVITDLGAARLVGNLELVGFFRSVASTRQIKFF